MPDAGGLYCAAGGFHVDPARPVRCAVVTHAHADHARGGSARYVAAAPGAALLQARLGQDLPLTAPAYGERLRLGDATVSLHPAGHVTGSAQVRVEAGGEVWVVSGDYKRQPDPTCEPFEVLPCDVFVSEATFALPVYRWPPVAGVVADIVRWWRGNAAAGRASLLYAYALGKAQRLLAELAAHGELPGPLVVHAAVERMNTAYARCGVDLPGCEELDAVDRETLRGALVLAPPAAAGGAWTRRLPSPATGFCSGWMRVRGARRRGGWERGFVLSDHADWPALVETTLATGARRVLLSHGFDDTLARYLAGRGLDAGTVSLRQGAAQAGDDERPAEPPG